MSVEAKSPLDANAPEAIVKSYSKIPEPGAVSRIVAVVDAKLADYNEPLLILTSSTDDEILS